jgi:hypothetical protein
MRWFLSDEAPELEAALRARGEEVVSQPEDAARRFVHGASFHPNDYSLDDLPLRRRAEVVVLVEPIRVVPFPDGSAEFGYARGHGRTLRNRGVTLAMLADLGIMEAFLAGRHRTCACQPNDVAVLIVPTVEAGDLARKQRRTALWRSGDDVGKIVGAVQHAREGKTYSPRRQGREWG